MGLCKSCFSAKYLGSSPDEANVDPDAQRLIVKSSSKPILVTIEPLKSQEIGVDKLEKCETGDSGTCIDELYSKQDNPKEKTESKEEIDVENVDNDECEQEVDLVQLTVSSVTSFGGALEDVPEHCELGGESNDPDQSSCEHISYSEQDTVTTQLSFTTGLTQIPEGIDSNLISFSPNIESDKENSPLLILEDSQQTPRKESFSSVLKPIVKPRTQSFGSARSYQSPCPPDGMSGARRQFIIHKVNSKSLLNSTGVSPTGVKQQLSSRQGSRNSSISGPSKGSLPSSRTPSRPGSRPPSRPPSLPTSRPASRDPSPENEDSLSELPQKQEKKQPRFSVIGVEGQVHPKLGVSKERVNRSSREKSPVVSFAEEVFDYEERQYQTVHAGCEIPVKSTFRERTRSGRFSRERRKSSQMQGSRPSIIDWPMGKLGWLKDRKRSGSSSQSGRAPNGSKEQGLQQEGNIKTTELNGSDLSPKSRPRSKSDRFTRPTRKQVVDVYKQAAFDWPLGQLGKIKQKYQKTKSTTVRSKSDENLSETPNNRLKRRSSERHGKSRKVAFEDQQATPWWNYPMRLMKNATNSSTSSNVTAKKRRRRHYTDPESRKPTKMH